MIFTQQHHTPWNTILHLLNSFASFRLSFLEISESLEWLTTFLWLVLYWIGPFLVFCLGFWVEYYHWTPSIFLLMAKMSHHHFLWGAWPWHRMLVLARYPFLDSVIFVVQMWVRGTNIEDRHHIEVEGVLVFVSDILDLVRNVLSH